ncbi:hypothetical protein [Neptunicella sp.]|uniref:hypothetical protein n=1 Tax=Neptunicella sp. TaxID=2125986 RepID=UPI003F691204
MSLYEEKFVLFVDILGWGELVFKSEKEENILSQIHGVIKILIDINNFTPDAVESINSVIEEHEKIPVDIGPAAIKAIQFSDSLVFTFDNTVVSLTYVYAVMAAISSILANMGYFVRGGIDYGNIYHEDGGIFGPAMNNAYYIESKEANVPRILFSERAEKVTSKLQIPSSFTFIDKGRLCLNNFDKLNDIENIISIVNDKVSLHKQDAKLAEKYQWVKERLRKL